MCYKILLLLSIFCLSCLAKFLLADPTNQTHSTNGAHQNELSKLKETLAALEDLTSAHRQVWEKQRAHEEEVRNTNKEVEEKESARSRTLEAEQILLRERSRKFARKLEALSKRMPHKGNEKFTMENYEGGTRFVNPAKDCSDIYLEGDEMSNVYKVWPTWYQDEKGFSVYCDMAGGGWTIIYRSTIDDFMTDYFSRSWHDYKYGFGDLESSFWLGNERIYQLTRQGNYELRMDMETEDEKLQSVYGRFFIEGETAKYRLHVARYMSDGTGGDKMTSHNGANFSTYDQNNLPQNVVSKFGHRSEGEKGYRSSPPECAGKNACGWWFNTDCVLDSSIHPTRYLGKIEMKIRRRLYSQKISES